MSKKDSRSKFLSLVLRHKPEVIGLNVDNHGWAKVEELLLKIGEQDKGFTIDVLKNIVSTDSKGRYSFNEDTSKIRANQGHSLKVDVDLKEATPPKALWHGTATRFMDSIMEKGLVSGSRLHVHLSDDYDVALKVGKRHGSPLVLFINVEKMVSDGHKFYLSNNGVWLVNEVPIEYIIGIGK